MTEPDHVRFVPVADGVDLHARIWDGADGIPFVLVHGLASNARLWDGVAVALADKGHPVVAVDQRGHGRSSKPADGYDMATVTDDLRALLDDLAGGGLVRPVLAGQSWGGNVVIELAARFPGLVRAVVAVDGGAIHLRRRFPDWADCAAALRPPSLVGTPRARLEQMLRSMHADWPETGIRGTLANFEVRDDDTVAPWLDLDRHLQVLRGLWEHEPVERYPLVREPVLFLNAHSGDDDEWLTDKQRGMDEATAALADVRVEWVVGHHDLHAQHPERVAALLHSFSLDVDPTGSR